MNYRKRLEKELQKKTKVFLDVQTACTTSGDYTLLNIAIADYNNTIDKVNALPEMKHKEKYIRLLPYLNTVTNDN